MGYRGEIPLAGEIVFGIRAAAMSLVAKRREQIVAKANSV
jgi:hypothetical protein